MLRGALTVCALAWLTAAAWAEPVVLRMANVAPEGTLWAHAFKDSAHDLSEATQKRLQMKWFLGGIAGDEPAVVERMKRGQLDGAALTLVCERLAPSLKVMRAFDDLAQHDWVMAKLRPRVEAELDRVGLVGLGMATLGTTILFTRQRVGSLDELRKLHLWVYTADDVMIAIAKRLALHTVNTNLPDARAALEEGKIDGFLSIPAAVFAYQWATRLKFFAPDLHFGILSGCVVVTKKAYERLSADDRAVLRDRMEKLTTKIGERMHEQDNKLLGELFQKHGLAVIPINDAPLKALLAAVARAAHDAVSDLVSPEVVSEVRAWAEQYRNR